MSFAWKDLPKCDFKENDLIHIQQSLIHKRIYIPICVIYNGSKQVLRTIYVSIHKDANLWLNIPQYINLSSNGETLLATFNSYDASQLLRII